MKRHSVADSRARISDPLDAAAQGEPAVAERRGVRRRKLVEYIDPDVATGQWTWEQCATGLELTGQKPRK